MYITVMRIRGIRLHGMKMSISPVTLTGHSSKPSNAPEYFITPCKSFSEAQIYCQEHGGELATAHSQREIEGIIAFVVDMVDLTQCSVQNYAWVNGNFPCTRLNGDGHLSSGVCSQASVGLCKRPFLSSARHRFWRVKTVKNSFQDSRWTLKSSSFKCSRKNHAAVKSRVQ